MSVGSCSWSTCNASPGDWSLDRRPEAELGPMGADLDPICSMTHGDLTLPTVSFKQRTWPVLFHVASTEPGVDPLIKTPA
eukprot:2804535-Prymnesium_polylepis.1